MFIHVWKMTSEKYPQQQYFFCQTASLLFWMLSSQPISSSSKNDEDLNLREKLPMSIVGVFFIFFSNVASTQNFIIVYCTGSSKLSASFQPAGISKKLLNPFLYDYVSITPF